MDTPSNKNVSSNKGARGNNKQEVSLRVATPNDAPALLAIYAPYVRETAISFEYEVPTVQEFEQRIANILRKFPYIVAEHNGLICGYAYAGAFKSRAAYAHSAEMSVYVSADSRGLGVGTQLYHALERVLSVQNIYNFNACIATPACEPDPYLTKGSIRFHEKMGYELVGTFHGCAYKFNRFYNMVWMEKLQVNHAECMRRQCVQVAASLDGETQGSHAQENAFANAINNVARVVPFSQLDEKIVQSLLR